MDPKDLKNQTPQDGQGAPAAPPESQQAPPTGEPPVSPPDPPQFTQADLARIVSEERKKEQAKAERAIEDLKAQAGLNETERYKLEAEKAQQANEALKAEGQKALVRSEVRAQAIAAGVKAENLEYVLRLVDLESIAVEDFEVQGAQVKDAVTKLLTDMPALAAAPPAPPVAGRSGTDFSDPQAPTFTTAQIAAMSPKEYAAQEEVIMTAMREGRITRT